MRPLGGAKAGTVRILAPRVGQFGAALGDDAQLANDRVDHFDVDLAQVLSGARQQRQVGQLLDSSRDAARKLVQSGQRRVVKGRGRAASGLEMP